MKRILMERSGELEVFIQVVADRGFSAAARSLGLTPSAVSKLISRLETRFGARLFMRTTRALTLTEEGEAYWRSGQQIIRELNEAEQSASAGSIRGRLRISASIPFGTMFAGKIIPGFIAKYPEVLVDLSLSDDVVDLLAQRMDVAIRMGNLPDSTLLAKRLGQSRRVICASPAYLKRKGTPMQPKDLREHDCLTFNFRRANAAWPFREKGTRIDQPISGNLQVNNGETLKQMILAGAGIGRVGLWHVADEIRTGKLVALLEKFNPGDSELMHAVYVGGGHVPNRVRAFIDYVADSFKASRLS
ncbi:LysR family transcriptional regulator [Aestuariivirga litoralis]|uniref:LysR family transcriptional regulator n=1 Tax=Aestuariivirga litoralis TaxID=2650924 RepID=UPI0018C83EC1|nr:LysR family transcriptional regulator [Aestuariivirga litoralis]MBG1231806.1 LysR family transcriptional regulator [Aestuariivirga litoralis]